MTTHLSTSLPNALRAAACVVGMWTPAQAHPLPRIARRRPSVCHAVVLGRVAPH